MDTATVPSDSGVGARLSEILSERGWSLSQLSRATNKLVSTSQLSLLTRGKIQYPRVTTLRLISGALGVDDRALIGAAPLRGGERTEDLRAFDGIRVVPVVRVEADGRLVETGETAAIAAPVLAGRDRLLVAIIEGGGCSPHVLVGDRVVFDPDATPQHRQMVLVTYHGATIAAWYMLTNGKASYRLSEPGSWLQVDRVVPVGVIVYIMRPAPEYLP